MRKGIVLSVRVDPMAKAAIEAKATRDGIPMSDLLRRVLADWLVEASR